MGVLPLFSLLLIWSITMLSCLSNPNGNSNRTSIDSSTLFSHATTKANWLLPHKHISASQGQGTRRNLSITNINQSSTIEHDGMESPAGAAAHLAPAACKTRHYFTLAEFQSDFKDTLLNLSARQIVPCAGCLKQWDDRGVLGSENFLEISNREADYYYSVNFSYFRPRLGWNGMEL